MFSALAGDSTAATTYKNQPLHFLLFIPREFSVKCHGCQAVIDKSSLVMTANNFFYHVHCFVCNNCNETLVPGDQYSVSSDGQLHCHSDSCIQEKSVLSDDAWSDGNSSASFGPYKETGKY